MRDLILLYKSYRIGNVRKNGKLGFQ